MSNSKVLYVCTDCSLRPPGRWEVNDDYMRDKCEAGVQCDPCVRGETEWHEPWSESSPKWACDLCGVTNIMFNEVYQLIPPPDILERLESIRASLSRPAVPWYACLSAHACAEYIADDDTDLMRLVAAFNSITGGQSDYV